MSSSSRPNPPWTQYETVRYLSCTLMTRLILSQLELLTEILKTRELDPDRLLPMMLEKGEPQWEDVALPRGALPHQILQLC